MSGSGAAAGWYDDPHQPSQLRYFDGTAWTDHTSTVPGAVATAGTTVLAAPRHRLAPTPVTTRRWYATSPRRVLVISVITIASLFALSFAMQVVRAGARASDPAAGQGSALPGPALVLSPVAPPMFVGRTPGTAPEVLSFKAEWAAQESKALGLYPGASTVHAEVYGPGPTDAPARGNGIIAIAWAQTRTQFPMDDAMREVTKGFTSQKVAVLAPVGEPSGAQIVCGSTPTFTLCQWIRSGTGYIQILEYGTQAAVVQDDARALASQLTSS